MKWEWLKETRRILIFLVVSGISKGKYSPINIQYKEAKMQRKELRRRGHIHPHSSPGGEVSQIYGQGSKLCSWRWIPIFRIEESFPKLEIPTQETTPWVFFLSFNANLDYFPKKSPGLSRRKDLNLVSRKHKGSIKMTPISQQIIIIQPLTPILEYSWLREGITNWTLPREIIQMQFQ